MFYVLGILYSDLSVREWVRPENLWTPFLKKKQMKGISPNLVTDACVFIDVLIIDFGVRRSKVKVTAGGDITVDGSPSSFV